MLDPFSSGTATLSTKQSFQDNSYHLPAGSQVAPQPTLPQLRSDLMDIERERINLICGCFGVPQSLIMSGSGRGMGGHGAGEVEYRQLMRTIDGVSSNVIKALTVVYRTIYPDEPVEFALPMMPLTTIENLLLVYREGVISKQTEGERLLRAAGLPATDLDIQDPKPTDEATDDRSRSNSIDSNPDDSKANPKSEREPNESRPKTE